MANFYAIYPAVGGGSGSGGITSINGDTTAAQVIAAGTGISVGSSGGTTTITNTSSGATAITQLIGDVTAGPGPGSVAAHVAFVGGVDSTTIAAYINGATANNTPLTLAFRDGTGNFAAGTITAALSGNATSASTAATLSSTLVVAKGGTNSSTALNNNRVMTSSGGAIVEAAAIAASKALASDANGIPVAATTTAAELNFVAGVTSAIQTQIDGKQATGNYITALTGDVTASGPGSSAATLVATTNATLTTLSGLTTAGSLATIGTITSGTWSGTTIAINKGGTGQTSASAAFGALSPLTTKGDLVGFDTANARVPVGANGTSLIADSTQTLGVKWDNPGPLTSRVFVASGSGSASTNTAIATFSSIVENTGSDITYAGSSTLGDSFTINTNGVYAISHTNVLNNSEYIGISRNSTQLSTSISAITDSDALAMTQTIGNQNGANCSATIYLSSGDVIRAHNLNNFVNASNFHIAKFIIQRVS